MKLLTIAVFSSLAIFPLPAQDQPKVDIAVEWLHVALQAQKFERESRFAEAAEAGKRALQLAKHFDSSDSRLAVTYHLLGLIYRDSGHCAESRADFTHAIAIWHKLPHPTPRYIFNSVTSLISTMCECDDFQAAEKAFRNYQADLQKYRQDQLDDAKILSLRAVLARGKKDYGRSDTLYRQTLDLLEKIPEATPVEIASERSSLAVILNKEGRPEESLAESLHAIAFFEKNAPKHPSMVASLNNAACALADLGRKDESERMFQRALGAANELYGEDNRATAKIILNYAGILRQNQQGPAAETWQKRGADAFRRALRRDTATVDVVDLTPVRR
jgi:tetratricopeptide (TPR) repeat protein